MNYLITIPGHLPSLNEYITACRGRKGNQMGALMKRNNQSIVESYILMDWRGLKLSTPVKLHYIWYEPNAKRDLDNVSGFGHKVIQDALVTCGLLPDDSQKYVIGYSDEFRIDRENPRIEVEIEEYGNG